MSQTSPAEKPTNSGPRPLAEYMAKLREVAERAKARNADPVYQANSEKHGKEADAREAKHAGFQKERFLDACGVPPKLRIHESEITETSALQRVKKFLALPDLLVLVLAGGVGTGKSLAAAWGASNHAKGSRFVEACEITDDRDYDRDLKGKITKASLLVIDDLGAEFSSLSNFTKSRIWNLMDKRLKWNRKTIITTNISREQLKANYGQDGGMRFLDRMNECGVWFAVTETKSMRKPVWLPKGAGENRDPETKAELGRAAALVSHWSNREPGEDG